MNVNKNSKISFWLIIVFFGTLGALFLAEIIVKGGGIIDLIFLIGFAIMALLSILSLIFGIIGLVKSIKNKSENNYLSIGIIILSILTIIVIWWFLRIAFGKSY